MKGATLLSKSPNTYCLFAAYLKGLGHPYAGGDEDVNEGIVRSICLNQENKQDVFAFYDRRKEGDYFELHETPVAAINLGYQYAYAIECRSEELFCEIVGATPPELDIMICDTNGQLFLPKELDPKTISL